MHWKELHLGRATARGRRDYRPARRYRGIYIGFVGMWQMERVSPAMFVRLLVLLLLYCKTKVNGWLAKKSRAFDTCQQQPKLCFKKSISCFQNLHLH
jgi:hypothetical protein